MTTLKIVAVCLIVFQVTRAVPNAGRVSEIRGKLMYPYYKQDHHDSVNGLNPRFQHTLNFNVPVYGGYYNQTWIELNGYVAFSRSPLRLNYPLKFPLDNWPMNDDPPFIAPFLMLADVGKGANPSEEGKFPPGLYLNVSNPKSMDESLLEAIKQDIQNGMIGGFDFNPNHYVILTWRNVTFSGSRNPKVTNTYQMVLTTDGLRTYVVFNYDHIEWYSSPAAGGNTNGLGGNPAFIGFNSGNGTRAFEYKPYSQWHVLDLTTFGLNNGFAGRHIFRVDEEIEQGACNLDPDSGASLTISPKSGHMLGGTLVNITGLCLRADQHYLHVSFNDQSAYCSQETVSHMVTCVTPAMSEVGDVDVVLYSNGLSRPMSTKFYYENPLTAKESVQIVDMNAIYLLDQPYLDIRWNKQSIYAENVSIELFGHKEAASSSPPRIRIGVLAGPIPNTGSFRIDLKKFENNTNRVNIDMTVGVIKVKGVDTFTNLKMFQWSQPILLGWYFNKMRIRHYGKDWPSRFCKRWDQNDRQFGSLKADQCPCTLTQAKDDKGRFFPDPKCDGIAPCYGNKTTMVYCVYSALPDVDGSGKHCCYGENGLLVTSRFLVVGIAFRAHPLGRYPYSSQTTIPGFSFFLHDMAPYFDCCIWQSQDSQDCYTYMWRRPLGTCNNYSPPNASIVFGDPHFITFNNNSYTFNGKGEFSLVNVWNNVHKLNIQGRFEEVIDIERKRKVAATQLTSLVAQENRSTIVEVQLRPKGSWRYHLDVIVNGSRIFFDSPNQKSREYANVSIHTPINVIDQSQVTIMFRSGAAIEVVEKNGSMAARIYLPKTYKGMTRGLMGNWSSYPDRDLVLPPNVRGSTVSVNSPFQKIHNDFGMHWMVTDSGSPSAGPWSQSLFYRSHGRSSSHYNDKAFKPNYEPAFGKNTTVTEKDVQSVCRSNYQCRFDYISTGDKEFAMSTKYFCDQFYAFKKRLVLK